jgi:hypothetical protein
MHPLYRCDDLLWITQFVNLMFVYIELSPCAKSIKWSVLSMRLQEKLVNYFRSKGSPIWRLLGSYGIWVKRCLVIQKSVESWDDSYRNVWFKVSSHKVSLHHVCITDCRNLRSMAYKVSLNATNLRKWLTVKNQDHRKKRVKFTFELSISSIPSTVLYKYITRSHSFYINLQPYKML